MKKVVAVLMTVLMTLAAFPVLSFGEDILWGDVSCDGKINMPDFVLLQRYLYGDTSVTDQGLINADVTHDGNVDWYDLIKIRACWMGFADADSSGDAQGTAVTTNSLPTAYQGKAYEAQLACVSHDVQTITWEATNLPSGLSIDADTGIISGTPTNTGTADVTVTAKGGTRNNNISNTIVLEIKTAATISPETAAFDLYQPVDMTIDKTDGDLTLQGIKNGNATLVADTDYSISGNQVTIKKEYLKTCAVGTQILTFNYGMDQNPTLTITVSDTTPVERRISITAIDHGTIRTNPSASAAVGTEVTVTAVPADGYKLDRILVDAVAITGNTFIMPDKNVVVTAIVSLIPVESKPITSEVTSSTVESKPITSEVTSSTVESKETTSTESNVFKDTTSKQSSTTSKTHPQTGDVANGGLFVMLLLLAGSALAVLYQKKR